MKKLLLCVTCGILFAVHIASAQPTPSFGPMPPTGNSGGYVWVGPTNSLPKFDLDFHGGTPEELVAAIVKITEKPLNAIVPDDCKDLKIPAFSVKNVTVAQLFPALQQVCSKNERWMVDRPDNNWGFEERVASYGFKTEGVPGENSIWCFYREGEPKAYQTQTVNVCQFFQMSPYLDKGYTLDDITTAIRTAWKMLGATNLPELSFHKETRVLIAVGPADKIRLIDNVLAQLSAKKTKSESAGDDKPKDH